MSECQANSLASDSEDKRKTYKAEVRAERKARKEQQKKKHARTPSFRARQNSKAHPIQPQSHAIGKPATSTATATATGGRPGNCWY